MSPVLCVGLLLLCTGVLQAFKPPGGGDLMEDDENMWGVDLMDREELPAKMTRAAIPGACYACKYIIKKVKAKINGPTSKIPSLTVEV